MRSFTMIIIIPLSKNFSLTVPYLILYIFFYTDHCFCIESLLIYNFIELLLFPLMDEKKKFDKN